MASDFAAIRGLLSSGQLRQGGSTSAEEPARWGVTELAGRLVELVGAGSSAALTAAAVLVLEAQQRGEPTAWITRPRAAFFPPDLAHNGVDLQALVVVRAERMQTMLRSADHLLRAGAFGLVVLDVASGAGRDGDDTISLAAQVRLGGLAKRHDAVLLLLLPPHGGTASSLASLRAVAERRRVGEGRYVCALQITKDKRRGRGWDCELRLRGPLGLR